LLLLALIWDLTTFCTFFRLVSNPKHRTDCDFVLILQYRNDFTAAHDKFVWLPKAESGAKMH